MRPLTIRPLAESGLLVEVGDRIDPAIVDRVTALAAALDAAGLPGLLDVVPSYTTIMLPFDPEATDGDVVAEAVRRLDVDLPAERPAGRPRTIPVAYGGEHGPDLAEVAERLGLSPAEVVARHAAGRYRVACMGFAPGFAFLLGLPPELATPRRPTPRTRVPVGSVAIGGEQTGIYPLETPGGWNLIGRTPLRLFDPAAPEPILLQPGDEVRFVPIEAATGGEGASEPAASPSSPPPPVIQGGRAIEVLAPGPLTTVQDLGRPGRMRSGVTPGGALDRAAVILGNRLVGNPPGAAALECTLLGPRLRFRGDAVVAVTGAPAGASVNGAPIPAWVPFPVRAGDELALADVRGGARAYVCVAGGIDVPPVLGGRGTDLFARFGGLDGRALRTGDLLPVGPAAGPADALLRRRLAAAPPGTDPGEPVRVVLGPQDHRFTPAGIATFLDAAYRVTPRSDRMGLRLDGPEIEHADGADLISEGIAAGAIQVPGDGQPIALLPARQTIGGYPKIATIVGADLDRLGQCRPGDALRFAAVDVDTACRLTLDARAVLGDAAVTDRPRPVTGWAPPAESVDPDPSAWTPEAIASVIERAARAGVVELRLEMAALGIRLELRRAAEGSLAPSGSGDGAAAGQAGGDRGGAPPGEEEPVVTVPAPLLGVFYRRANPEAPPYVEEGQGVRAGEPIGLLEVMKTFHEVAATADGTVAAFLVEDGAFVEYGQPLATIRVGRAR